MSFVCITNGQGRRNRMSEQPQALAPVKQRGFSIDAWAVLLAFVLAALVRAGVFKHIPW
jgi:hypothetical protein